MDRKEGHTITAQRDCDCGSLEDWEEVGSTWLCTCPDKGAGQEKDEFDPDRISAEGWLPSYSDDELKAKILEMYPEISRHGISFRLNFNARKNAYILDFRKDRHELTTHLEKKDADECMANIKCVYLGVQVGQFMRNFEEEVSY